MHLRQLSTRSATGCRALAGLSHSRGLRPVRHLHSAPSNFDAEVSLPVLARSRPVDAGAKAHHRKNGRGFENPWPSFEQRTFAYMFRNIVRLRLAGQWNDPDVKPPTVTVRKPSFLTGRQTERLRATWLGHACYYVEFPSGLRLLFDPVFEHRCSPLSFIGPERYTPAPCQVPDIPFVDAVVISHNHYDHLSFPTIKAIMQRHPAVRIFVPLGNKPWFKHMGLPDTHVIELDWWEECQLHLSSSSSPEITATLTCLPAQHGSGRTAFDRQRALWASWSIISGTKRLWFGGDTGYRTVPELPFSEFDYGEQYAHLQRCPAFPQIGEHIGPFDLGLIPIGAYAPRFIMSAVHADPYDAVNIFLETRCKRAMGIHWGTWALTTEPVLDPPRLLKQALKRRNLPEESFQTCEIGESREF